MQAVLYFLFYPKSSDCLGVANALEFIFWSMRSTLGRSTVELAGFLSLNQSEADSIVRNVSNSARCALSGQLLIQPEILTLPQWLTVTLVVLGAFSAAASTCTFAFLLWQFWTRIGRGEVLFLSFAQASTLCLALVSFGWASYPPSDSLCKFTPWLILLPLAMLLAAICGRLVQVFRIWTRPESSSQDALLVSFFTGAGVCFCVFLVILATWTGVNPMESIAVPQDPVGFVFSMECASDDSILFWLLFSWIVVVLLCLVGIIILLLVWNINPVLGESRWLFVTLYSALLGTVIIGIVLFQEMPYNTVVMSCGYFLVLLSFWWIPLYGTKIYHARKRTGNLVAVRGGSGRGDVAVPGGFNHATDSLMASRIIINSESGGPYEPASPEVEGRLPFLEYPPRLPAEYRRDSAVPLVTPVQSNIDHLEEESL